jgi:hypothetical protein
VTIPLPRLPAIQSALPDALAESREMLLSNRNRALEIGASGLESSLRTQAVLSFLLDADLDGFHHGMHLAASARLWFLGCVRAGMPCLPSYLLLVNDAGLYEALCGGETGVIQALARDKQTLEADERLDNAYDPFFSFGLRLLVMDQRDAARQPFDLFDQARGTEHAGKAGIAHGLLDSDEATFNAGLRKALDERQAEIPEDAELRPGEEWLSVELLGLARLGQRLGLEVTVRHPLLPRELLGMPGRPYPDPAAMLPPIPTEFVDVQPTVGARIG